MNRSGEIEKENIETLISNIEEIIDCLKVTREETEQYVEELQSIIEELEYCLEYEPEDSYPGRFDRSLGKLGETKREIPDQILSQIDPDLEKIDF